MARENQGLHFVLIFFVTLSVILGAIMWVFIKNNTEAEAKIKSLEEKYKTKDGEYIDAKKERDSLLQCITGKADDKTNLVLQKADEIMKKLVGGPYPDDVRYYEPLVLKLNKNLDEKNAKLAASQVEVKKWEAKYKAREAEKQPQIDKFQTAAQKAEKDRDSAKKDFDERRADAEKMATAAEDRLKDAKKEASDQIAKLEEKNQKLTKEYTTAISTVEERSRVINDLKRTIVDDPDGEIRWVNQNKGLVWINVGRADGLQPLMTFSVYPLDVSDLSKGSRKGTVEVTQILGDHMAEARITDDNIAEPIIPGDKIDTSLWNPGEQLHFALAGVMDVNGNNRNNIELVQNLIALNNGVVDAYEDERGNVHHLDNMSIGTRFLVLGEIKNDNAATLNLATGQTTMMEEAKRLGIQTISLKDLLQRMGYRPKSSNAATGGENLNSGTYQAKPSSTPPRTKSSENFKPRQPATPRPAGAY
jgi:hypothetical protein